MTVFLPGISAERHNIFSNISIRFPAILTGAAGTLWHTVAHTKRQEHIRIGVEEI